MRKKVICLAMVFLIVVGAAAPKKAYAIAGVDDMAVAIVLALAAAAGITFTSNDGVQDAVKDFLKSSGGKYDSTLEKLSASAVSSGGLSLFRIPVAAWSGVKLLLEGLFSHFKTDENRKGAVTVAGASGAFPYHAMCSIDNPSAVSFFKLKNVKCSAPCYIVAVQGASGFGVTYYFISSDSFSFTYFESDEGIYPHGWITQTSERDYFKDSSGKHYYYISYFTVSQDYSIKSGYSELFATDDLYVVTSTDFCYRDYSTNIVRWILGLFSSSAEKSIPYGLTFPQDMKAPDVIDNFEQKVKEGAGDTAIAVPVEGVIDSTLPWADAWEKYLVNVNEVGDITDSTVETNTWLGKILTAVKAIPATLIDLLEGLLVKLFYPSDSVLSDGFNSMLGVFKEKTDSQTYLDLLSRFQSLKEPDLADITINWYGKEYVVVTWDFFRRTKPTYSRWLRGFLYLFLLLFNFNNLYKMIRNGSVFSGSGHGSAALGGGGKRK